MQRRKATQDGNILTAWPIIQQRRGIGRHRPTFLVTIPRGGHADFFDDGMYSDNSDSDDKGGNGDQNQNMDGAQHGQQQPYDANNQWEDQAQDQLQNYHGYGYDSYQQQQQQQQQQLAQAQAEAAQEAAYLSQVASRSRMNARTASLALRLTVEINRRLRRGTEAPPAYRNTDDDSLRHLHMDLVDEGEASELPPPPPPPQPQQHQSSWQMQPFRQKTQEPQNQNEHEWQPKIRRPDAESGGTYSNCNQHTIFHADRPRNGPVAESLAGDKRWRLDLHQYIEEICRAMECSNEDTPLVLARALMYLDRACSVETERHYGYQNESSQPCPPLLPQTVHRLVLAAMVLSCRVSRGQGGIEYDGAYCEISTQFGVASNSLATMEAVMRDALGGEGLWIDFYKLVQYLSAWRETFTEEGANGDAFSKNSDGSSIAHVSESDESVQPKPPVGDAEDFDENVDDR